MDNNLGTIITTIAIPVTSGLIEIGTILLKRNPGVKDYSPVFKTRALLLLWIVCMVAVMSVCILFALPKETTMQQKVIFAFTLFLQGLINVTSSIYSLWNNEETKDIREQIAEHIISDINNNIQQNVNNMNNQTIGNIFNITQHTTQSTRNRTLEDIERVTF